MTMRKGNQGFTITELLVAMTIASVVMAAIYSAYISQQKAYAVTEAVTDAQQNLRAAMYALETDIRLAGFDPRGSKTFGFGAVPDNATSITFTYDNNSTAIGLPDPRTITYQLNTTVDPSTGKPRNQLETRAGTVGAFSAVAANITDVRFTGLAADGVTTVTPSTAVRNIRFVRVVVTARVQNHTKQLTATILCRNMGL
jgi:type IV pilus assembly protein PilW